MFFTNTIQNIINAGTQQLIQWVTQTLPPVFLFLIFFNAVTRLIGRERVEKLAVKCGSNALLRYLVLPFLSAVVLGNPMAISMGRWLPEEHKPAYFASASYHCHTNSGIFQHINPAELFLWLGIANGVSACGLSLFPLAVRYLCAGLLANLISGYSTEIITKRLEKTQHVHLQEKVDFRGFASEEPAEPGIKDPGKTDSQEITSEEPAEPGIKDPGKTDSPKVTSEEPAAPGIKDPGKTDSPKVTSEEPAAPSASGYRSITITRGDGGWGGPVTVTPTKERHIVLYMIGGGSEPEPLAKILSLSGMTAVNGNQETCPDEQVALAIIDCGGTLRCGIYPGKGIPTLNILATGRSGPLAKYMTADLYVSAVTSAEISPAFEKAPADCPEQENNIERSESPESVASEETDKNITAAYSSGRPAYFTQETPGNPTAYARENSLEKPAAYDRETSTEAPTAYDRESSAETPAAYARESSLEKPTASAPETSPEKPAASVTDLSPEKTETGAPQDSLRRLHGWFSQRMQTFLGPASAASKVVSIFHQSARDAVKTCLEMLLPFMGFAALFIGICRGSGLTQFLAGLMGPMGGSLPGLFIIGIVCSVPGLSAILGAGAVAAQMFAAVIGDLIRSGSISPAMALPALFAINCQCACDFIPVGLGMMEAKPRTTQIGFTAITLSRFMTGWLRILIALIFSIGLYT